MIAKNRPVVWGREGFKKTIFKLHIPFDFVQMQFKNQAYLWNLLWQGIDSYAHKPALIQDTDYMVKKTDNLAPYLGPFGADFMPQLPV